MTIPPDFKPLTEMADFTETRPGMGGRPAHAPTDQTRAMVVLLHGMGANESDISKVIGITRNTLRKHYEEELEAGKAKMDAHVYTALYKGIAKLDAGLIKYYMNNRLGWSEKAQINVDTTIALAAMPVPAFNRLLEEFASKGPTIDGQVVVQDGPLLPAPIPVEPE